MGNTQAAGFAEAVQDGLVRLDVALEYHLRSNHFPPAPYEWIEVAKTLIWEARDIADDEGVDISDWMHEIIDNPVRDGDTISKGRVMDILHLWSFVS